MSWKNEDWDRLMESLEEEECLLADGFDLALIGISCGINPVAVYDVNKIRNILVARDGMSVEEAQEHMDFNIVGGYVGEKTPLFIDMDFIRACAFTQDPKMHEHSSDG